MFYQFAEPFKLFIGDIEICHFFLRVIVGVIIEQRIYGRKNETCNVE